MEIASETPFFRIFDSAYSPFFYRDMPRGRFDDFCAEFGVMYLSRQEHGAFAETISRQFFDRPRGPIYISLREYEDRRLARLRAKSALRVVDLTKGSSLLNLRLPSDIANVDDYFFTQRWARAFYHHRDEVDGILYPARHAPETQSLAVFDRFDESKFEHEVSIQLHYDTLPRAILDYVYEAGITLAID
jgi:hypothetical protein